jgi:ABC-type phosphate transport system auxiliary subunit
VERTVWTDERIDDAMERIEKRFDRLEDEMAALRREMHQNTILTATGFLTLAGMMLATSL